MPPEDKTAKQSVAGNWMLRTGPETVFGQLTLAALCAWAEQGRLTPDNEVSHNGRDWVRADSVPDLKMDWYVLLKSGANFGPINMLAVPGLFRRGMISRAAVLEHKLTHRKLPAADLLKELENPGPGLVPPGGRSPAKADDSGEVDPAEQLRAAQARVTALNAALEAEQSERARVADETSTTLRINTRVVEEAKQAAAKAVHERDSAVTALRQSEPHFSRQLNDIESKLQVRQADLEKEGQAARALAAEGKSQQEQLQALGRQLAEARSEVSSLREALLAEQAHVSEARLRLQTAALEHEHRDGILREQLRTVESKAGPEQVRAARDRASELAATLEEARRNEAAERERLVAEHAQHVQEAEARAAKAEEARRATVAESSAVRGRLEQQVAALTEEMQAAIADRDRALAEVDTRASSAAEHLRIEKQRLAEERESLTAQQSRMHEHAQRDEEKLAGAAAQEKKLQQESGRLQGEIERLKEVAEQQHQVLAKQQARVVEVQRDLGVMRDEQQQATLAWKARLAAVEPQTAELQAARDAAEAERIRCVEVGARRLALLEEEKQRTQAALQAALDARAAVEAQAAVAAQTHKGERERAKEQVAEARLAQKALESKLAATVAGEARLRKQIEELREENAQMVNARKEYADGAAQRLAGVEQQLVEREAARVAAEASRERAEAEAAKHLRAIEEQSAEAVAVLRRELSAREAALHAAKAGADGEVKQLVSERDALSVQLAASRQAMNEAAKRHAALEQRVNVLTAEGERLRQELADGASAQAAQGPADARNQKRIAEAQEEFGMLRKQLAATVAKGVAQREADAARFKTELAEARKAAAGELSKVSQEAAEQLAEAQRQRAVQEAEIERLQGELQVLDGSSRQQGERLEAVVARAETLAHALAQVNGELVELEKLRETVAWMESAMVEQAAAAELAEQQAGAEQAEAVAEWTARLAAAEADKAQAEAALAAATEDTRVQLEGELTERTRLQALLREQAARTTALVSEIAALNREQAELVDARKVAAKAQTSVARLTAERDALGLEAEAAQARIEKEWVGRLADAEKERQVRETAFRREIEEREKALRESTTALDAMRASLAGGTPEEKRQAALQIEEAVQAELEQLALEQIPERGRDPRLVDALTRARKEMARMHLDRETLAHRQAEQERAVADSQMQIESLKSEVAAAGAQVQDREMELELVRTEVVLARTALETGLVESLADRDAAVAKAAAEWDALRERLRGLATQLRQGSQAIKEAEPQGWRVRLDDGIVYGPVVLNVLRSWAADCRLGPGHAVATEQGEWLPAES
ncbi:MAG: hypothetical protein O3B24_06775, partial [Verrucomicrobia bacterium]|nr:hypothetical protein [Verrucomicrobiota bacterium]